LVSLCSETGVIEKSSHEIEDMPELISQMFIGVRELLGFYMDL